MNTFEAGTVDAPEYRTTDEQEKKERQEDLSPSAASSSTERGAVGTLNPVQRLHKRSRCTSREATADSWRGRTRQQSSGLHCSRWSGCVHPDSCRRTIRPFRDCSTASFACSKASDAKEMTIPLISKMISGIFYTRIKETVLPEGLH